MTGTTLTARPVVDRVEPGGAAARGGRRRGRAAGAGSARRGRRSCSDSPSVAIIRASWRAASQFSGPCPCSMRARSPRNGHAPERVRRLDRDRSRGHGRPVNVRTDPQAMTTVVVTGAAGRVGRRVLALLAADAGVERVVAIDVATVPMVDAKVERHRLDLPARRRRRAARRRRRPGPPGLRRRDDRRRGPVAGRRRAATAPSALLDAAPPPPASATSWCCRRPRSTAPGPTTRCPSPRTPRCARTPSCAYAVERARIELLLATWRPTTRAASPPCCARAPRWRRRARAGWPASLAAATGMRPLEEEPPAPVRPPRRSGRGRRPGAPARLDGPATSRPTAGSRATSCATWRRGAPAGHAARGSAASLARLRWRFQRGPIPPGLLPLHAPTRGWWPTTGCKAAAGQPRYTNEQAYVAGTEAAVVDDAQPAAQAGAGPRQRRRGVGAGSASPPGPPSPRPP